MKLLHIIIYRNVTFQLQIFPLLELKCPADCSGAGVCDTTIGECTCEPGRHGLDCSSEIIFLLIELVTL